MSNQNPIVTFTMENGDVMKAEPEVVLATLLDVINYLEA